jgi:membrane-bound serine protease (ClpP class)
VAYIRGLAELRGRNSAWAERAVREASSLSSSAAARENVIDFTAATIDELLRQADGRTVQVGQQEVTRSTAGLTVEEIEPDWRTRLLAVVTDPNVALILMMIGIYGLIFEFMNPGTLIPGTIGGISLLVGLYALAVLPVSFAGVGLILLGMALIVAEAFAPSFGILGIGGAVALVLGATILFDTGDVPGIEVSWPVIAAIAVASLGMAMLVARLAVTSRRVAVVSGRERIIGAEAIVLEWTGNTGWVRLQGERWRARGDRIFLAGDRVRVVALDGLTVEVAGTGEPAR